MKFKNKIDLYKLGIYIEFEEDGSPKIMRYGKLQRYGEPCCHQLKPQLSIKKHPYGHDKIYHAITIKMDGIKHKLYVHRLVYIWCNGSIADGLEIDHIDGCPLNNRPENLRAITHKENLACRSKTPREISCAFWKIKKSCIGCKEFEK